MFMPRTRRSPRWVSGPLDTRLTPSKRIQNPGELGFFSHNSDHGVESNLNSREYTIRRRTPTRERDGRTFLAKIISIGGENKEEKSVC